MEYQTYIFLPRFIHPFTKISQTSTNSFIFISILCRSKVSYFGSDVPILETFLRFFLIYRRFGGAEPLKGVENAPEHHFYRDQTFTEIQIFYRDTKPLPRYKNSTEIQKHYREIVKRGVLTSGLHAMKSVRPCHHEAWMTWKPSHALWVPAGGIVSVAKGRTNSCKYLGFEVVVG